MTSLKQFVSLCFALCLFASTANASHGPFPPSPESRVVSSQIEIYSADGSLIEIISDTGNITNLVLGSDMAYSGVFGNGFLTHFRIFGVFQPPGVYEFDFFDGNTGNGVTTPFSLDVGVGQAAFQYTWYVAGNQRQIVIGLLDVVNTGGGLWTISSVDTEPSTPAPGTSFLAGPLTGNSVRFEMIVSVPLPGALWLLLSGLIPAIVVLRK